MLGRVYWPAPYGKCPEMTSVVIWRCINWVELKWHYYYNHYIIIILLALFQNVKNETFWILFIGIATAYLFGKTELAYCYYDSRPTHSHFLTLQSQSYQEQWKRLPSCRNLTGIPQKCQPPAQNDPKETGNDHKETQKFVEPLIQKFLKPSLLSMPVLALVDGQQSTHFISWGCIIL